MCAANDALVDEINGREQSRSIRFKIIILKRSVKSTVAAWVQQIRSYAACQIQRVTTTTSSVLHDGRRAAQAQQARNQPCRAAPKDLRLHERTTTPPRRAGSSATHGHHTGPALLGRRCVPGWDSSAEILPHVSESLVLYSCPSSRARGGAC